MRGEIFFSHREFNAIGVCIMIPNSYTSNFTFSEGLKDQEGRLLLINCRIEENLFHLLNLYCPTKDNLEALNKFLSKIRILIEDIDDNNLIIGGDFNTCLNPDFDKKGGNPEKQSTYTCNLIELCEELSLCDIWRVRNPNKKLYTRRENTKVGLVQSRLDFFLISENISYQIKKTCISPSVQSDHSILSINLDLLNTQKRGRGYWKFNNSLLQDINYVNLIKNKITELKNTTNMVNKTIYWDYIKCEIRTTTIEFSIKKAQTNKQHQQELQKTIESLESNLNTTLDYDKYILCKTEYDNLIRVNTQGIILRSKAQWIEEGEKNTKFFLNLEKRNYNRKYIKKLINNKEQEVIDPVAILEEQKNFYKSLYSSQIDPEIGFGLQQKFLSSDHIPKLSLNEQITLDEELTMIELSKSLKNLANNKSPGPDGLTTNFYKCFWPDIKELLHSCYLYSFKNGELSQDQRTGILNLLPKDGKDLRYLANWRPISLLNTDYKILTKALATRIQKVLPDLIDADQVGYMKNRYIGENIRILSDLIKFAEIEDIEAYIAQIDFEKAFDSIEWPFLLKTLESFNFGPHFVRWIRIIYTNIQSCIGNNGYYSTTFKLSRSIRQGCPISALLFILVAEVIAIHIRNDDSITGIIVNNIEFKISLMADDTTIYTKNIQSIVNVILKFSEFAKCSGLKINLKKTEIIPIGSATRKTISLPNIISMINIKKGPFKALGVWYSTDQNEITELNLNVRIKKMQTLVNIWTPRCLSLKGKVTIIRSLILPQIQFLFTMIYIPTKYLDLIEKTIFNFLWNNKTSKIKKSTIIAPIENGGLNMVDVYTTHLTAKCRWVARLYDEKPKKWQATFLYMLNIPQNLINKNLPPTYANKPKTEFHKQIVQSWLTIYAREPICPEEVKDQWLCHNQFVKIDNKLIDYEFCQNIRLYNIKSKDIINESGKIISRQQLSINLNCTITILQYNSIVSAFPRKWKELMKTKSTITQVNKTYEHTPCITISTQKRPINKINSKELYKYILSSRIKDPTAIDKWLDIYPFLENSTEWKKIYTLSYKVTKDTYLHSFQYKVLNRIINCNDKLFIWGKINSNKCHICNAADTIEHHFFLCPKSKVIWAQLSSWLKANLSINHNFTICEIIFGIIYDQNNTTNTINYIILLTKWYINKCKTNLEDIYFFGLLQLLRQKIEIVLYNKNNEFEDSKTNSDVCCWQQQLYNAL